SSLVAFCFIAFALYDITCTLPFSYPLLESILSTLGEFAPCFPFPTNKRIPKIGQYSGTLISLGSMEKGTLISLALFFELENNLLAGFLRDLILLVSSIRSRWSSLYCFL